MNIFTGSVEIQMLCWSVVLGLVQLVIATSLATKDQGLAYNLSPRDVAPPPVTTLTAPLPTRLRQFPRDLRLLRRLGSGGDGAEQDRTPSRRWGPQIYFWARLAYVPVYAAGIPVVRTCVWTASRSSAW